MGSTVRKEICPFIGGPTWTRTRDQRIMRAKHHGAISRFFLRWRLTCCPGFPPVSRVSMALRRVCVECRSSSAPDNVGPEIYERSMITPPTSSRPASACPSSDRTIRVQPSWQPSRSARRRPQRHTRRTEDSWNGPTRKEGRLFLLLARQTVAAGLVHIGNADCLDRICSGQRGMEIDGGRTLPKAES
jgi:hypothetical protein